MQAEIRRARRRAAQREAILAAAKEIARRDGWRDLTIRKIADLVEYAPPIVYEHFTSKDALLKELLLLGFREICRRMLIATEAAADSKTRTIRLAETVMDFAADHPELYRVMHGLDGVPFGTGDTPREAREAFHIARGALQSLAHDRGVTLDDVDDRVDTLWAVFHGFISLDMAHRIRGGSPRVRRLLLAGIESLLVAWGLTAGPQQRLRRTSYAAQARSDSFPARGTKDKRSD
jgi:AcrR family transcriptional regulator